MVSQRFGLALRSDEPHQHLLPLAVQADELGFESIWLAEEYHFRSVGPLAALVATQTKRARVGLGIVPTHTRHPALTAMEAATLDEIAYGRIVLGLGAARTAAARHGEIAAPIGAMRETLTIVRRLLNGEQVTASGKVWSIDATKLDFGSRAQMPIYIGTFPYSTQMLRLAGELADGVLLVWTSPETVHHACEEIAIGARRAGRPITSIDIGAYLVLSVDEDGQRARDACRPVVAAYAPRHVRWIESGLVTAEELEPIRAACVRDGIAVASRLVSDTLVDKLAVAGTPRECRDRIAQYRLAGLDLPIAYQVIGPEPAKSLRLLAEQVFA